MKKLPTLHILNGDASVPAFRLADLPGQMLVWREILASGPAVYSMPQHEFWQMRQQFITDAYHAPTADYQEKVLNMLQKFDNASNFFEVVLWFDQDLVCQVNLLYILHRLSLHNPAVVSVCTPIKGSIGYKTIEEVQQLFEHRKMLEPLQLKQASEIWQLYAGPAPVALQYYLHEKALYSETLKLALELHLQRFPAGQTYLGNHQEILLATLVNGAKTVEEVQQAFWKQDPGYGFGDWQLQTLLKELSPELVQITGSEVTITEMGKQVVDGRSKFRKELTYWLGGVQQNQQNPTWCRDSESGEIKYCAAHTPSS